MPAHPGGEQPEKAAAEVGTKYRRKSLPSPEGVAPNLHEPVFVFLVSSFLQIFFSRK